MRRRWFRRVLQVAAVLAALLVLFLVFERVRGQIALARYKKALVAKGEKLTLPELQASNAAGENGAPAVLEAIRQLKEGTVLPRYYPPRMAVTPTGRAVVCFREAEWVEGKQTNHWDDLAADLKTHEALLAEIRAGLEKPALNNAVDISLGTQLRFLHLAPAKSATYWLGSGSQLALHRGDTHAAMPDLLALARLPRLLAEDHILISELVRNALGAIAKVGTWEALQADGWTDDDLAELQKAWEAQDFVKGMALSLEGERIYMKAVVETMRRSTDETFELWFGWEQYLPPEDSERPAWERLIGHLPYGEQLADFLKKQVYCRVWRLAWSHQYELRNLRNAQRLLDRTRRAAAEKSLASVGESFTQMERAFANRSLYDKLRFPEPLSDEGTLPRAIRRALRGETDRSMTLCAIALKRYQLKHGKLPTRLDALVPEFVSTVPVDYMDGQPLRYRLNAGGSFTLYSMGEDLTDDGGDTSWLPDQAACRNLWGRKDCVWPAPATAEEVAAYHEETRKR